MIKLRVQPFCESCLYFHPEVIRPERMYAGNDQVVQTDTVVYCKDENHCLLIKQYLERQMLKGENDHVR